MRIYTVTTEWICSDGSQFQRRHKRRARSAAAARRMERRHNETRAAMRAEGWRYAIVGVAC